MVTGPATFRGDPLNRHVHRMLVGAFAGLACSPILVFSIGNAALALCASAIAGVLFLAAYRPAERAPIDGMMEAATFGVPAWALLHVIALPLLHGESPRWTAEEMRGEFSPLVGWVLFSAALGLAAHVAHRVATRLFGAEAVPIAPPPPPVKRIVILGGGFAGVSTAEHLERLFRTDGSVAITLVSETNALLFTPMLAEVAASSLEATHISSPLRTSLKRTTVVRGVVTSVDTATRRVHVAGLPDLEYDHLVVGLGSVSNYLGMTNVQANAFDFKSLADAIRIRNHVIDCFERADRETDAAKRRSLVTFVVAGGGFAGAELTGGLNDFARGMLAWYPSIPKDEVRVILVHGGERILNELSEPLALYAQKRMTERGVTFRLKTRLKDAGPDRVVLSDGEVEASTLVWTAGTAPSPVLKTLGVELDKRGALVTDETLLVKGQTDVWAIGDAAAIPDARTGKSCPPTAQFAIREARQLAKNIHARVHGRPAQPFAFEPLGALCVVGHHTACAEIRGLRFSGLFAWLMWRGIYLGKLPSFERKVRVLVDWVIELFFPRDIVQTIDLGARERT
jgi:NADH dehydrogenase